MKHIAILKGASGTGKSTKVYLLINFLRSIGETLELKEMKFGDKFIPIGLLWKEQNVLFLGKEYQSDESIKFISLDYLNSKLGSTRFVCKLISSCIKEQGYSVFGEGEPMMVSNRYRALYFVEEYGVANVFLRYYVYGKEEKQRMIDRIIGRTPKEKREKSKKRTFDGAWGRNFGYYTDYKNSEKELPIIGLEKISLDFCLYTEPVSKVGIDYLNFLSLPDLSKKFEEYCKEKRI